MVGNVPAPRSSAPNSRFPSSGFKPTDFYKIILNPTMISHKLRIPGAFSDAYGDELGPNCTLTVPTGVSHKVALVEEENMLWFIGGWKEFCKRYSVEYGYFLVFSYAGNSHFRVNVFDMSLCEVCYGRNAAAADDMNRGVEVLESEEEDDVVHSPSETPVSSDDSDFALLSNIDDDMETNSEGSEFQPSCCETSERINISPPPGLPIWLRKYVKELKALADAGIAMPANPFFVCSIGPSNLKPCSSLSIPVSFARKHLINRTRKLFTLRNHDDGIEWQIQCFRYPSRCALRTRWPGFARNVLKLKVGDTCMLELIDASKCVLKVRVLRSG